MHAPRTLRGLIHPLLEDSPTHDLHIFKMKKTLINSSRKHFLCYYFFRSKTSEYVQRTSTLWVENPNTYTHISVDLHESGGKRGRAGDSTLNPNMTKTEGIWSLFQWNEKRKVVHWVANHAVITVTPREWERYSIGRLRFLTATGDGGLCKAWV